MFFKRKVEKMLKTVRRGETYQENSDTDLEKGDLTALILSAVITFGPIILILLIIALLLV